MKVVKFEVCGYQIPNSPVQQQGFVINEIKKKVKNLVQNFIYKMQRAFDL